MAKRSQSEKPTFKDTLAQHGLRATRLRTFLLERLYECDRHPTAAALYEAARTRFPRVSLKTVYEALDAFVAAGLAVSIRSGTQAKRYEACRTPHYHARCRICDELYDVPIKGRRAPVEAAVAPRGFVVESVELTLVGCCRRCAKTRRAAVSPQVGSSQ